jgi:hypothetical protein
LRRIYSLAFRLSSPAATALDPVVVTGWLTQLPAGRTQERRKRPLFSTFGPTIAIARKMPTPI